MASVIVCTPSAQLHPLPQGPHRPVHSIALPWSSSSSWTSPRLALPPPSPRFRLGPTPAPKRRKVGPPAHFRLFEHLPLELVERVLVHLDLEDLGRLRRVNLAFHALLSDPRHYADVSIPHLSHVPTELLAFLPSVLCGTRHLSLRSFPSATLSALLPACSSRLTTLDLSFSGVRDDDLLALVRPGGRDQLAAGDRGTSVLHNLRALRLKGCRRLSAFLALLCSDNDHAPFPSLETLDLSWSSLSALPLPLSAHLPRLEDLNLSTTPYLALPHLVDALASLPPRLGALDLSHLGLRARDLRDLGAGETPLHGTGDRGALRLVLAGNDSLTHQSLATLRRHWAAPHSRWGGRARIEVEHSPVLLESDDEDDVRRFVELVAGVVMRGGGGGGGQGEAAVVRSGGRGTR